MSDPATRHPSSESGMQQQQQQQRVLVEICIDSPAGAAASQAAGADRVELCSSLVEGGVTPSYGAIKAAAAALTTTRLMVLVRPRGGDFLYTESEVAVMIEDIRAAAAAGAAGVATGALTAEGAVDVATTVRLLAAARQHGLDFTFHRAFDMCRDLSESLEQLAALGVPRVLTSGGRPSAVEGQKVLRQLVEQSAGRVSVLAGGGVRAGNVAALVAATGVAEVHSSARGSVTSGMLFRPPPSMTLCGPAPSDWVWGATDEAAAREVVAVVRGLSPMAGRTSGVALY